MCDGDILMQLTCTRKSCYKYICLDIHKKNINCKSINQGQNNFSHMIWSYLNGTYNYVISPLTCLVEYGS